MDSKRSPAFYWLICGLCLAPALIYAWLGQFSRTLDDDDYCPIVIGQEMGPWDGTVYWYHYWSGGYSSFFFAAAMAPLDTQIPRIAPALFIAFWMVGLSWLVFQGLAYLKIDRSRRLLSVAIAALAVAASINAFYSPQSFYWYFGGIRNNTLSLPLLTIYLALALWIAGRGAALPKNESGISSAFLRVRVGDWGVIIAGAALCFISAGASEVSLAFQLVVLTFCLLASFALLRPSARYRYALVFGMGWLATLGSMAIQLPAPGVARRMAITFEHIDMPNRSLSALMPKTFSLTFDHLGHPEVFAGFVMLMGVGLLVMLIKYRPPSCSQASKPVELVLPALWLGLIFQLLWMPLLWLHTSEHPQLLGRFSVRYMAVVLLNAVFILSFLILLWQRKRIHAHLQKHDRGLLIAWHIIGLALIFVLLFLSAQVNKSIDRRSVAWLFTNLLALLVIVTWQLLSMLSNAAERRFGLLALCSSGAGLTSLAVLIGSASYSLGHIPPRALASSASLLVLSGLVWGAFLGYLAKRYLPSFRWGQTWIGLLKLASLAVALVIGARLVLGQTALAPYFGRYAQEWDQLHIEIIAQRDSGQKIIETAPWTYDMPDYVDVADWTNTEAPCAEDYYGVDTIRRADA